MMEQGEIDNMKRELAEIKQAQSHNTLALILQQEKYHTELLSRINITLKELKDGLLRAMEKMQ